MRERRLVAVGGLVGAIALCEAVVVAPIAAGFSERAQERDRLRAEYAHAEQTIAVLPRLRRLSRFTLGESKAFTIGGVTPDAAGLALEERLRIGVEAAGGEYRGGNHDGSLPDRIQARAVIRIPVEKLVPWLAKLENEQPFIIVEQLAIAADAALASQKTEPLDVNIEVSIPYNRAAA